MNNKQIATSILHHASKADNDLSPRIAMYFDGLKITANNNRTDLESLAKKFSRPKRPHTDQYYQAQLASKGPICRREPIAALIKRYPEETEAFTLLAEDRTQ